MTHIINIRECPYWIDRSADYFSDKWNINRQLYFDSINDSLSTDKAVPRWYLILCGEEIIGGFGLIENDFMVRTDLCPWLCALYIEPAERGRGLGSDLLTHGRSEAAKLGYDKIYLNTDHIGYYEKFGWRYIGSFEHQSGEDTRVYEADAVPALEEMSAFFNIRADTYDSHMLDDLKLDEFYSEVADCFHQPVKRLLDLGCGTGLELDRLFERFPDVEVTGIDMSAGMLDKLKPKHQDKKLRLICGSYFDTAFGGPFDCVLSTYSLHHFSENSKLDLYKKVYAALESGGQFIFGDYTVSTIQRQQELLAAQNAIRLEQGLTEVCFYHFDIPFTAETECRLMKEAGFRSAMVIRQWENTSIIQANK